MKEIFNKNLIFTIILGLLMITSCEKEENQTIFNTTVDLDKGIEVTSKSQEIKFNIEVNKNWTSNIEFSNESRWCSITPTSGVPGKIELTLKVNENLSEFDRNATLIIYVDKNEYKIKIKQFLKEYLSFTENFIRVTGKKTNVTIPLTSNVDYVIEIPDTINWIHKDVTQASSKSINLGIDINTQDNSREGLVIIKNNESELRDTLTVIQDSVFNYSSRGTANTYTVSPNSFGKIKISNKGNDKSQTIEITKDTQYQILWSDNNSQLVYEIDIIDDFLYFQTSTFQGNALIAIKNNDEIAWSWHLWILNDAEVINSFQLTTRLGFMDRNLGAINKTDGGFHYQWGRKDPFLIGKFTVDSIAENLERTINNPTVFNIGKQEVYSPDVYSWYKNMSTSLWGKTKTIYDPCPYGYKVPQKDSWLYSTSKTVWNGQYYIHDQTDAYYPMKGVLGHSAGDLRGWWAGYWTSEAYLMYPFGDRVGYHLSFADYVSLSGSAATFGMNVRCVRNSSED